MEDIDKWSIIWTQIGWKSLDTKRDGWAISSPTVIAWIENDSLAIHDEEYYYPSGCYDIPIKLIEELKKKENYEQSTTTSVD